MLRAPRPALPEHNAARTFTFCFGELGLWFFLSFFVFNNFAFFPISDAQ
jgi:hypothetical protein